MKTVLILYPIQPYVDSEMIGTESSQIKTKYAQIYQDLIRQRYPGFQAVYLLFSAAADPQRPDLSQLWPGFSINEGEVVGACGLSFQDQCQSRQYPDPQRVIDLCSKPVEKLVIGGFHLWDCVDKVASYAHEQGIDVSVDEDLTQLFFSLTRDNRGLPVFKIPVALEESLKQVRERLANEGDSGLEHFRAARKARPWLVQI